MSKRDRRKEKGYGRAKQMKGYADRKGGFAAAPDGFDRSDPGTLANLVDDWMTWLEERNYSDRSVVTRKAALRVFLAWAHDRDLRRPEEITKPILESYQRWLYRYRKADGQPIGITTQRGRLGAVQALFSWLCRTNRLTANPAADLELPRQANRILPRALTVEDIAEILAVPDVADPLGIRERAMLELFYSTGIRRIEIVRLDIEDVDLNRRTLFIRGKGNKHRMVPVGKRATNWLLKYLEHTRPLLHLTIAEHALFLTGYGERFSPDSVGNWVRRVIEKAGIERPGSCHMFRHACATHMLENGADIRYIQQLLGHARLDTTQIYTDVAILKLRDVHDRCHPAG